MATRSLSPKRAAERMQRFQHAVRVIALMRAKKAIQAQIRARGERIADYSCRDISVLAEAYMAQHRDELINKATVDVASYQSGPKSITSTVQMLGAK
jgi:hypothetical protein